jgi:hypothetical protein
MSALGQKQTLAHIRVMSALPPKRTLDERVGMSALCQKRTHAPQQKSPYYPVHGVGGAQQSVDCPRLAADFGRDPASHNSDKTERRHPLAQAQKPHRLPQPVAQPQHLAGHDHEQHDDANADRDPEGEDRREVNLYRLSYFRGI